MLCHKANQSQTQHQNLLSNTVSQLHPKTQHKTQSNAKVKILPSGKFTAWYERTVPDSKSFKPLQGINSHKTFYGATKVSFTARELKYAPCAKHLESIALDYEQSDRVDMADYFSSRYATTALGLSDVTNSHILTQSASEGLTKQPIARSPRGSKGATQHQKDMITSGLAILETKFSRKCLTFGTATLPLMTESEQSIVCKSWSKIANRFMQEITRLLDSKGLSNEYLFVTEIQEKRYRNYGNVAPHLHWIMQGRKNKNEGWYIKPCEIKVIWERILENVLDRKINGSTATRIEQPKKSLKAEMGKYLSKGSSICKQIINDGKGDLLPSSYMGCSKTLKAEIAKETKIIYGFQAQNFINNMSSLQEVNLIRYFPILYELPDRQGQYKTVGYAGYIRDYDFVNPNLNDLTF